MREVNSLACPAKLKWKSKSDESSVMSQHPNSEGTNGKRSKFCENVNNQSPVRINLVGMNTDEQYYLGRTEWIIIDYNISVFCCILTWKDGLKKPVKQRKLILQNMSIIMDKTICVIIVGPKGILSDRKKDEVLAVTWTRVDKWGNKYELGGGKFVEFCRVQRQGQ